MDLSRLKLAEIRRLLAEKDPDAALLEALARDPRAGAREIYRLQARRLERAASEAGRVESLFREEFALVRRGYEYIAGVDEAGRGPLAGPVVAAAVILPVPAMIPGLDDSKRLAAPVRERVAADVLRQASAWGIGLASVEEIDDINILRASLLAMRRALAVMGTAPQWVLVDGSTPIADLPWPQRPLVGGDATSASVAAASVLAKVFRDRLMEEADLQYPAYGFAAHKGYATKAHYRALARWGPCPLHRRAFLPAPSLFPDMS
ncbi:MAG: ribonuclease HII [Bacillota bacterium]|nr:ribonuclease HII [Bacillota bacterium]